MKVVIDGEVVFDNVRPQFIATGYRADSIEMQAGDFESLAKLAETDPRNFRSIMLQLDARFRLPKMGLSEKYLDKNRPIPPFLV